MKMVSVIILVLLLVLAGLGVWQRGQTPNGSAASTSSANAPVAPEIASDTWLNSPTLAPDDLRGKVVVIEFWTFG